MKKKTWAIVLSVVLVLALAITGTFAWLTDRDSEVNVFTMGNVDIDLTEDFEQGATLTPGVQIEKAVQIENTGKNDAWVWYTIAYPKALDLTTSGKTIIWTGFDQNHNYIPNNPASQGNQGEWIIEYAGAPYLQYYTDANGVEMVLFTALYQKPLANGEITPVGLEKVYLDKHLDIDPEGNLAYVDAGVVEAIDWNINEDGAPVVYICAYAVQTEGFADVETAYAAYQEQWGANGAPEVTTPVTVKNVNELDAALKAGETVIVLEDGEYTMPASGDNKTFTLIGTEKAVMNIDAAGYENCNYNLEGADVTFNGITIAGNGGWARSKTTFINCTITGAFEMQATPVLFENCTFNLNNSYIWTLSAPEVTFDNCVFNTNGKALLVYNHGATDCVVNINNCEFNASAAAYTGSGKHVAAVSIDATNNKSITVNFTGTNTAQTGADAFAGLCQIKGGASKITVNGATPLV